MTPDEDATFIEVQRFTQWWIKALAAFLFLVGAGTAVFAQMGQSRGGWFVALLAGVGTGLLMPSLLYYAQLTTKVSPEGLFVRFRPFHFRPKRIDLSQLADVEPVTYRPIVEYGGWGIRSGRKGNAYNVSGNLGVRLTFTNGRHLLIGSQRPEELASAILPLWQRQLNSVGDDKSRVNR